MGQIGFVVPQEGNIGLAAILVNNLTVDQQTQIMTIPANPRPVD